MADAVTPWPMRLRLGSVPRAPLQVRLEPDAAVRKALAKQLGLVAIDRLEADVAVGPWLDGAELTGWIKADVVQTCSVTADPLDAKIDAGFAVRLLPPDSPNITEEVGTEIEIDAEADDPPDVLEDDMIDVSHYVVEHLALELDPFPRKPGAVFEAPEEPVSLSPFAALAKLRESPGEGD
jgi:uncharacterized metal-binding protein YceD (DUF177 family)